MTFLLFSGVIDVNLTLSFSCDSAQMGKTVFCGLFNLGRCVLSSLEMFVKVSAMC